MCQLVIMELGGGTRRGSADRPEQSLRSLGPPPSGLPLHPLCTTYTKPQPPAAALTVGRTETQKCTESKSSSQSHSHTCRVPAGPYTHDVGRLQGMQSGRREARYQNPPSTAVTAPKKSSFWPRSSHSVKTAELRLTEGSGGRLPLLSFALSAQQSENGTKISLQEMTGKPKVYHNIPADQRGSYLQHKLCWTKTDLFAVFKEIKFVFQPWKSHVDTSCPYEAMSVQTW